MKGNELKDCSERFVEFVVSIFDDNLRKQTLRICVTLFGTIFENDSCDFPHVGTYCVQIYNIYLIEVWVPSILKASSFSISF